MLQRYIKIIWLVHSVKTIYLKLCFQIFHTLVLLETTNMCVSIHIVIITHDIIDSIVKKMDRNICGCADMFIYEFMLLLWNTVLVELVTSSVMQTHRLS